MQAGANETALLGRLSQSAPAPGGGAPGASVFTIQPAKNILYSQQFLNAVQPLRKRLVDGGRLCHDAGHIPLHDAQGCILKDMTNMANGNAVGSSDFMAMRKIAGPMRIESGSTGASVAYRLEGKSGGRNAKVAQYAVKFIAVNDTTNTRITLTLDHGPDGEVYDTHSTVLSSITPATPPSVKIGQADITIILCEWLRPTISIQHSAGGGNTVCWAVVEIYELRKPF